ncbi:hypothetical protein RBWH47_03289 [Rhodopirellula baltica WH47]|uniref:Uncharacterized protein n=1 Tax=Rhodopirellula baltica WH47 TaxID=991778 RepID=F2AN76_RHOBT|nr:hypothetical protein RBWH47_03289 [Rhodopirellula baltica WH47]
MSRSSDESRRGLRVVMITTVFVNQSRQFCSLSRLFVGKGFHGKR